MATPFFRMILHFEIHIFSSKKVHEYLAWRNYRYLGTVAGDDLFAREDTLATKYSFDPAEAERRFGSVFQRNYREESQSCAADQQLLFALEDA